MRTLLIVGFAVLLLSVCSLGGCQRKSDNTKTDAKSSCKPALEISVDK